MKAPLVGWLSFAAVSLFAPADVSAAETVGVVSVADPPNGPGPELAELTQSLRSVLAERREGVLGGNELRERMAGQVPRASLDELEQAYAGAIAAYQAGNFEGAIRTIRTVVEDLERQPGSPKAFGQWTRAMMRLARAEATLGHKSEAKTAIERLVKAAPGIKADPAQYPPSFQKQIEQAQSQLQRLPTHKLTVTVTPSVNGVKVTIDGREVGDAPATISLAQGKYRVSASQGTLRAPGVAVDLSREDRSVVFNFSLLQAMRPTAGPGFALSRQVRAKGLIAAGAWLGVDKLVVNSLSSEGGATLLVGTLYDVRRGMLEREGRIRLLGGVASPAHVRELASFLVTGRADSFVEVGKGQAEMIGPAVDDQDFGSVPKTGELPMDAGGWVDRDSNTFGIQGPWYWYSDSDRGKPGKTVVKYLTEDKPPYDPKKKAMCLTASSTGGQMDGWVTWGAVIGVNLNQANGSATASKLVNGPRCYSITLKGSAPAGGFWAKLVPDQSAPEMEGPGRAIRIGTTDVCIDNVGKPNWCGTNKITCLDVSSLRDGVAAIEVAAIVGGPPGEIEFCVTSIVPHE